MKKHSEKRVSHHFLPNKNELQYLGGFFPKKTPAFLFLFFLFFLPILSASASKILIRLRYPASPDLILRSARLIDSGKAGGVFLEGKWDAALLKNTCAILRQNTNTEVEIWSEPPSVPHPFLKRDIPFPEGNALKNIENQNLKTNLFCALKTYSDSIGVNRIVLERDNRASDAFYAASMPEIILKNSGLSQLPLLLDSGQNRLHTPKGNWHSAPLAKGSRLSIPAKLLFPEAEKSTASDIHKNLLHTQDAPSPPADLLASLSQVYEQSIRICKNSDKLLPIANLDSTTFKSVALNVQQAAEIEQMFNRYTNIAHTSYQKPAFPTLPQRLFRADDGGKKVLFVSLSCADLEDEEIYLLGETLKNWKKTTRLKLVLLLFDASPALLAKFSELADAVICSPQQHWWTARLLPQVAFGGANLPTNSTNKARLGFSLPEQVGLSSEKLARIDSIARLVVSEDAAPGCQVLVARAGKVVFQKNYGYHSYAKLRPVTEHTLYDLASLTKVLATLPALMHLEEKKKISLQKTVGDYLSEAKNTNKGNMSLKDILAHQAGLKSFIPHWTKLVKHRTFDTTMVSFEPSEQFPIEIAPGLYTVGNIAEKIWHWTLDSRLTIRKKRNGMHRYFYSDLGFYIFQELVERKTGEPLEVFTDKNFYRKMGMKTMTFNPLHKFSKNQIAPTEMDIYFRQKLVHGTVHDPGAAMKGGVSGHAGLFSNALDVAKMMQMYLQKGQYGNQTFLENKTLEKFNQRPYAYHKNRRALGWDKPPLTGQLSTVSAHCSDKTFGHSGFTGTVAWADPEENLVFVFLSNRIHPLAGNKKLIRDGSRRKIHDVVYDAIIR